MTDLAVASAPNMWNGESASHIPSYDYASEYKSLASWFKFSELTGGAGTVLADDTGLITDLAIVEGGAATEWDAFAFLTTKGDGSTTNCHAASGSPVPAKLINPTGPIFIEWDTVVNSSPLSGSSAAIIEVGDPTFASASWHGWGLYLSGNDLTLKISGDNDIAFTQNLGAVNAAPDLRDARTHFLIVLDRSTTNTQGTAQVFANGVERIAKTAFTSDPGALNVIHSSSKVSVGRRSGSTTQFLEASHFNLRVWTPVSVPSNIATIALDMANSPNHLSALMKDIV